LGVQTWPEQPGPDEWYLTIVPCKPPQGSTRFDAVWITLKCHAFPAHICDFRCVTLTKNPMFESQFDQALKSAMSMVRRLNLEGFRSELPSDETEVMCAVCGEPACCNDYLCSDCRMRRN
jgi:hypothetical protein